MAVRQSPDALSVQSMRGTGIGKAFAAAAGREGARVAVAARRLELLNALADEIGGSAHQLDITDPAVVDWVVMKPPMRWAVSTW